MKKHTFLPETVRIVEKKVFNAETVGFKIALSKPLIFHPGQFVLLSVLGFGEVPVGIASGPKGEKFLDVAIRAVGTVTEQLCRLSKGDELGITGPLGHGFPMTKLKGRDVVLIAGGLGIVPLRSLIEFHLAKPKFFSSLTVLIGAKNKESLLYQDEYKQWAKKLDLHQTIDKKEKGWQGTVGPLPKLYPLAKIKRGSVIISCGSNPMFKSVVNYFAGKRVADGDLYFLLERKMKCGVGKCQHCTCGGFYVCTDGPVFSYEKIKYNTEAFK